MRNYALTKRNPFDIDKITLFKGAALLGTGIGAYYLFKKSAIPVIGGASAYLIASSLKASELQAIAAAAAGTGVAFVAEGALKKKKDSDWCKEHYIQALWDDRCDDSTGDAYGFIEPYATRFKGYTCIWKGAQDKTADDCVSKLINMLHDAGFPPSTYPQKIEDSWLKQSYLNASFDYGVDAAVRLFQQSRGLKPDGIVGPDTWSALGATAVLCRDCPTVAGQGEYTTVAKIKEAEKQKEEEIEKTGKAPPAALIPWWAWAVTGVGVASLAGVAIYKSVKKKKRADVAQT